MKKTPSKVGYFSKIAEIVSIAGPKPKFKLCFIKIVYRATYAMTLDNSIQIRGRGDYVHHRHIDCRLCRT